MRGTDCCIEGGSGMWVCGGTMGTEQGTLTCQGSQGVQGSTLGSEGVSRILSGTRFPCLSQTGPGLFLAFILPLPLAQS